MKCNKGYRNKNYKVDELVKYVITDSTEINETNVTEWIGSFERNIRPYLKNLKSLYKGVDPISKVMFDNLEIDNQVHANLSSMIVKNATNYFIGKPVTHSYSDKFKNNKLDEYLNELNRKNSEKKENKKLAKDASIYGIGYELVNYNKSKKMYFKRLNPLNTFMVVNDFIFEEPVAVITYSTQVRNNKLIKKGYCYTADKIYEIYNNQGTFTIKEEVLPNVLKELPVVCFPNNDEWTGDFEFVTELLSAYNKLISCSFDDFESIANALLVLYNALLDEDQKKVQEL